MYRDSVTQALEGFYRFCAILQLSQYQRKQFELLLNDIAQKVERNSLEHSSEVLFELLKLLGDFSARGENISIEEIQDLRDRLHQCPCDRVHSVYSDFATGLRDKLLVLEYTSLSSFPRNFGALNQQTQKPNEPNGLNRRGRRMKKREVLSGKPN